MAELTFAEAVAADRAAADALTSALAALEAAQQAVLDARTASSEAYAEMRRAEARDANSGLAPRDSVSYGR